MTVAMNVALHAVRALAAGRLDAACNAAHRRRRDDDAHPVRAVLYGFFCASFLKFGRRWVRVRRRLGDADGASRYAEHVGALLQALAGARVTGVERRLARFARAMRAPPFYRPRPGASCGAAPAVAAPPAAAAAPAPAPAPGEGPAAAVDSRPAEAGSDPEGSIAQDAAAAPAAKLCVSASTQGMQGAAADVDRELERLP
jgi:hypothetical protein